MIVRDTPWRQWCAVLLLFLCFLTPSFAGAESSHYYHGPAYEANNQDVLQPASPAESTPATASHNTPTHALRDLHTALSVMQNKYFALWLGKWTTAIDWTAAVMSTHLAATLNSLSHSLSYTMPFTSDMSRKPDVAAQLMESEINKYFGHIITYYFGQDYFAIRNEAYDDMLWVVLGWLETIQLIKAHSERHYPDNGDGRGDWHAQQFIPAFAHRARVLYELAEEGWDWKLCGGGMTWNPRLLPYKNTITNQLFIAASVSMYLSFPGDDNCSPFLGAVHRAHPSWTWRYKHEQGSTLACPSSSHSPEYSPIYLTNAINGYNWLSNSGMLNAQGLYTDGFHITGYAQNHSKTACDARNEMLYTYNQGVILSALRNLWEATGNLTYLTAAHMLVTNVIRATNWTATPIPHVSFADQKLPPRPSQTTDTQAFPLGTNGILTEHCDPTATCTQDTQSFKGIFFHHLAAFCAPLPTRPARKGKTHYAVREIYLLHRKSCRAYTPWVTHNARAELRTRDRDGRFGMWWGAAGVGGGVRLDGDDDDNNGLSFRCGLPRGAWDYRNDPAVLEACGFTSSSSS